jgi:hypothetical protein
MKRSVISIPSPLKTLRFPIAGLALVFFLDGPPRQASAQTAKSDDLAQTRAWAPAAIAHAQKMRVFRDADRGSQPTPPLIPRFEAEADPSGKIATFQPGGPTFTALNPFFQNLGTNGRTCFTCHQPQTGWTVSATGVQARFDASGGTDPIFRLIDGATCPTDDVSTLAAKREAYKLVIAKGLIRIGLAMPAANLQFAVTKVDDPYHCTTNSATGLTSPTAGIVSVYRRPLPSTNLGFLSTIMADGREPSLQSQAIDATLTHAQGNLPGPTADQVSQIVAFESGIFTAQVFDNEAHSLHARQATGGPVALSQQLAKFFLGVNDPFGKNPTGAPFDQNIFNSISIGKASGETAKKRKLASRSRAARRCSTPRRSTSQGSRVSMTCLAWRALPDFAVLATTRPMPAIIQSRRHWTSALPMPEPRALRPSTFPDCRFSPSHARQVRSKETLISSPIRAAH